jgi:hypothetical protein
MMQTFIFAFNFEVI